MEKKIFINKLVALLRKSQKTGIKIKNALFCLNDNICRNKSCNKKFAYKFEETATGNALKPLIKFYVLVLCSISIYKLVEDMETIKAYIQQMPKIYKNQSCLYEGGDIFTEIVRARVDCRFCQRLTSVDSVMYISEHNFTKNYAYTGIPLLLKGAAKNWPARSVYNYWFFKNLYKNNPGSLENVENKCQFFPYKTDFDSIADVFNMSERRVNNELGENSWYIGWCDKDTNTSNQLKKYYTRPNFLPIDSGKLSNTDWIFMGWPGQGAEMHIDKVDGPSWQAQLKGTKTWLMMPSPECGDVCSDFNVTLESGDILTVDTNIWYHATYIHPGEMSISVGSEY